jgi:hypothetical protein
MRSLCVAFAATMAAGCMTFSPQKTTGWRFEVICPPTISAPAILNHSGDTLSLAGMGGVPVSGGAVARAGAEYCPPCNAASMAGPSGPRMATAPECTVEDCCRRLDRIEAALSARPTLPRPMPVGPTKPE